MASVFARNNSRPTQFGNIEYRSRRIMLATLNCGDLIVAFDEEKEDEK